MTNVFYFLLEQYGWTGEEAKWTTSGSHITKLFTKYTYLDVMIIVDVMPANLVVRMKGLVTMI